MAVKQQSEQEVLHSADEKHLNNADIGKMLKSKTAKMVRVFVDEQMRN